MQGARLHDLSDAAVPLLYQAHCDFAQFLAILIDDSIKPLLTSRVFRTSWLQGTSPNFCAVTVSFEKWAFAPVPLRAWEDLATIPMGLFWPALNYIQPTCRTPPISGLPPCWARWLPLHTWFVCGRSTCTCSSQLPATPPPALVPVVFHPLRPVDVPSSISPRSPSFRSPYGNRRSCCLPRARLSWTTMTPMRPQAPLSGRLLSRRPRAL